MRLAGPGSNLEEGILSAKDILGKSKDRSVEDSNLSKLEKTLLKKVNDYNNLVHWFWDGGIKWEEFKAKVEKYLTQLEGDQKKLFETILWKIKYEQIGGLYDGLEDLVNRLDRLDPWQVQNLLQSLDSKENISWVDLGVLYGTSEKSHTQAENIKETETQWIGSGETKSDSQSEVLDFEFNPETFETDVKNLFDQLSIKLNLSIYDKYYQDFINVLLEELRTYNVEQQKRFWEDANRGIENFSLPLSNDFNKVTEFFRLSSLGSQLLLRLDTARNSNEGDWGKTVVARESSDEPKQDELGTKLRTYWYKHYIANMFGDIYEGTEMMKIVEEIGRADTFRYWDFFSPVALKWVWDFEIYLSDILSSWELDPNDETQNKKIFYNALYATFPHQLDWEFVRVFVGRFEDNPDFQQLFFDTFNKITLKVSGKSSGLDEREFEHFLIPLISSKRNFEIVQKLAKYDDWIDPELGTNQAERMLQKEKETKLKNIRSFLGLRYLKPKDRAKLENIINDMDIEEIRKLDYLIKTSLWDALSDLLPEDDQDMAKWLSDNIGSIHGRFFEYFVGWLAASDGNLKELGKVLSKDSASWILSVILDDNYIKNEFLGYLRDKGNLWEIKLLMVTKELGLESEKTVSSFWHLAKERGDYTSSGILQSYAETLIGKKVDYDGDLLLYTLSKISPDKSNLEELFVNYRRSKDDRLRHFSKEMSPDEIKKYVMASYGEEFEKLKSDIATIDSAKLQIFADSIQAKIGLVKSNEVFKKLRKLDEIEEAADIIQTNYDFYIDRINASKLDHVEELEAKGVNVEVVENHREKIQADLNITEWWPAEEVDYSNVSVDWYQWNGVVKAAIKNPLNNDVVLAVEGSSVSEANYKLLQKWTDLATKMGMVVGTPTDFAQKLRLDLTKPLKDLQQYTSKLARYAIESVDWFLSSDEGKQAYKKLPPEQQRNFERLYQQVIDDPMKIGELLDFVNEQVAKKWDTNNFFWIVKSNLQTDPVKWIIDIARVNLWDYSEYQTRRFFEKKRDELASRGAIGGIKRVFKNLMGV